MENYDPRIQALLDSSLDRWGTPESNRETLVPYGVKPLDQALYGLDVTNGEMIIVQGEEKNRKTTFLENVVVNYMMKPIKFRPHTVVDMLESGMRPEKYLDTLIANVASRYLIVCGHQPNPKIACQACGGSGPCQQLMLTHKFLRYNKRSIEQQEAITWAMEKMHEWPMMIFGPRPEEGDTRNLEFSILGSKGKASRWERLVKEWDAKVFVTDHMQQYEVDGDDYDKMRTVIPAHSNIVAKLNVVDFVLSQVSLTSAREAASGSGKYTAAGGRKAASEANTVFSLNYQSGTGAVWATVEDSRDAGQFSIKQPLEECSGAFYGEATRQAKLDWRPGMGQAQQQQAGTPSVRGRRN